MPVFTLVSKSELFRDYEAVCGCSRTYDLHGKSVAAGWCASHEDEPIGDEPFRAWMDDVCSCGHTRDYHDMNDEKAPCFADNFDALEDRWGHCGCDDFDEPVVS